jgi:serpin B
MARTLCLGNSSVAAALQASDALRQQLRADTAVTLDIANSLWLRQRFPMRPEFTAQAEKYFGASVATLDFANPSATAAINGWVSQATRGKITKIIEQIGPEMALYLINAVYFKGTWQVRFDPARTADQEFYPLAGAARQRPLMNQSGHYLYIKGADFQAVKLPYRGGGTAMYIFLPDRKDGITAFLKQLTDVNWRKWTASMARCKGDLALPRLTAAYEAELSRQLAQLGMGRTFSDNADFSGISEQGLAISEVRHKTVLEVNEQGTVAAAVTSVGMRTTSVVIEPPPFSMTVDHPFFLAIADEATGAILFMGLIVDPQ